MKISFSGHTAVKTGAIVILAAKGPSLGTSGKALDEETGGHISRALKAAGFEGKAGKLLDIVAPEGIQASRIVVAGIGAPKDAGETSLIDLGGAVAGMLGSARQSKATFRIDTFDGLDAAEPMIGACLAFGASLRAYRFDLYKTAPKKDEEKGLASLTVQSRSAASARKAYAAYGAVSDGVALARDLLAEPANILYPAEFANRLKELEKSGLKVKVLGDRELKKLGMTSLLAVGEGSVRESYVVVMEWSGGGKEAPLAFIGKGVTFDTGGISLKPGAGMGDMKGDMGGAAAVSGLMLALAGRKAKVNAIGIVGLVENMPDGTAMRPGDVITSMSGKTIEVLNTDAEGRLVLADVLWYAKETYKPRFMIDLATLTGAIIISLGHEQAGLFSNDDDLAAALSDAGKATGELVWRLPLADVYDKKIESKIADMKNIGGRDAGSITAAQFLKRFVGDVPWAHLDIAGVALNGPKSEINRAWSAGFGVRLLDRLVADGYEKKTGRK